MTDLQAPIYLVSRHDQTQVTGIVPQYATMQSEANNAPLPGITIHVPNTNYTFLFETLPGMSSSFF